MTQITEVAVPDKRLRRYTKAQLLVLLDEANGRMTAATAAATWAKNSPSPLEPAHVALARELLDTQMDDNHNNPDARVVRDYLEAVGALPAPDLLNGPVLPQVAS